MSNGPVKEVLGNIGLTEKETEVYVCLAKYNSLKGLEVARRTKIDRAEVYRILRSLQKKGLIQLTLETPARFVVVPFEKVLDSFVNARRDELALIEQTKQNLVEDWKKINKSYPETTAEKFVVIEGDKKIYSKISQMAIETQQQLSAALSFSSLFRASQSNLFSSSSERKLEKSKFHFITDVSKENLERMKNFLRTTPIIGVDFRGRSPDLGLPLSPRMVVRDDKEMLLFITPPAGSAFASHQSDVCLWTDCKALVESFAHAFDDLWNKSTDIQSRILEIETGRSTPQIFFKSSSELVLKKYNECLQNAKIEILIVLSSESFPDIINSLTPIRSKALQGVAFKIMTPLTTDNLELRDALSDFCEYRHIPQTTKSTILVDGRSLFEFESWSPNFKNCLFTEYSDYVENKRLELNSLWNAAISPAAVPLEAMIDFQAPGPNPLPEPVRRCMKTKSLMQVNEYEEGLMTEKDVIQKIIEGKRVPASDPLKDINVLYGSEATAVIYPPSHLHLPELLLTVSHFNKQSSWGAEDVLLVCLQLNTPKGLVFVPVAVVVDNPRSVEWRRAIYSAVPAGKNVLLFRKNQLEVKVQGNTLFAGWTKPISLYPTKYILPPCCLLFEGHGNLRTIRLKAGVPGNRSQVYEVNKLEAFVTFFHPESKYSGPGTDGCLHRDHIMTSYPPTQSQNT